MGVAITLVVILFVLSWPFVKIVKRSRTYRVYITSSSTAVHVKVGRWYQENKAVVSSIELCEPEAVEQIKLAKLLAQEQADELNRKRST